MKGIHILCASQSSTSTLDDDGRGRDEHTLVVVPPAGSAIDRYNPIIHDQSRLLILNPHFHFHNNNANANANANDDAYNIPSFKLNHKKAKDPEEMKKKHGKKQEEKNVGNNEEDDDDDENNGNKRKGSASGDSSSIIRKNWSIKGRRSWSCMNPGGFISPPPRPGPAGAGAGASASPLSSPGSSSRFLLTENTSLNNNLVQEPHHHSKDDSSAPLPFQVVVLRVSLHCRGCEKKLRKHISNMEGVSSYNIEFAAKKVTVEGNVTPLGVLASISKVKNAQLWFPVVAPALPALPGPALPAPPQTISEN